MGTPGTREAVSYQSSSPISTRIERMFRNTVSPSDRRIIEHFLRDSDKELNEIKTTIMALESKQNGLKKKMDRYRTLLSPIHRLPPEVIVQVFTEVCDKNELYKKKLPSALALSRVCGRWRDIALATPRLWSSLRIPVVSWDSDEGDRVASLTRLFIERSRTAPLTLELWADIPDVDLITFIAHEALEILRGGSVRWRSLQVESNPRVLEGHFQGIKGNLPRLENLMLTPDTVNEDFPVQRLSLFENCPSLHSVALGPFFLPDDLVLPWSQIQRLTLQSSSVEEVLAFLRACPSIKALDVRLRVDSGDIRLDGSVTSDLKSLNIEPQTPEDFTCFFDHMDLPEISSLQICGSPLDNRPFNMGPLMDCIARSSCHITSLALQWMHIPEHQVISLLRLMPSLMALKVYDLEPRYRIIGSTFMDLLYVDHDRSSDPSYHCFLPNLLELTLHVHYKGLDTRGLLDALSSRCIAVPGTAESACPSKLKMISITTREKNGSGLGDFLDSIRCFESVGVRVNVGH